MLIKTGSEQLDFLMTVTLSGCRMSDRYRYTHPTGPDPGGCDPGGYPGRYHGGGGNTEEGLWTLPRPLLPATWTVDPLRGRAIQFWGGQWLVAGSWIIDPLWERAARSMGSGWSLGDCFTCWRCRALDRLWSQVRFCIFSTGGRTHGSGRSHDELSAIRAIVQRGGITPQDSIPWVFGDGFILWPVSTGCWFC